MTKHLLLCSALLLLCISLLTAQSIRKSWREMGPTEIADYNDALQQFWDGGANTSTHAPPTVTPHLADYPVMYWENRSVYDGTVNPNFVIHNSPYFLPFHRTFLIDWETQLKSYHNLSSGKSYSYLSVPYWNWTEDAGTSTSNITSSTNPGFWAYSFLPAANFSAWLFTYTSKLYYGWVDGDVHLNVSFSRSTTFNSPSNLDFIAGNTVMNQVRGTTIYYNYQQTTGSTVGFSDQIEGPEASIQGFVGGPSGTTTMSTYYSPLDPSFWLVHSNIDREWTDWEDFYTTTYGSSDLLNFPVIKPWLNHGTVQFQANLPIYTSEPCSTKVDNRYVKFKGTTYDTWYAENGSVLLNGNKNTTFHVLSGTTKIYRYAAYDPSTSAYDLGDIYVGDIKRVFNAVLPDLKGGFTVDAGATCHFRAAGSVRLMTGFTASAGSNVTISIINTPDGF